MSHAQQPITKAARRPCYEWARAAGCIAIVFLHVFVTEANAVGYAALGSTRVLVGDLLTITLTRWAVPVFLMVSGALLLDPSKDVGWPRLLGYARRMLLVLATFGLAFCLIESVVTHGGLAPEVVGEALRNLLTGNSWGHLWYVYALLGLYLLTPALRLLTTRLDQRRLGLVLAAAYVLALVVPTVTQLARGVALATPVNLVPAAFYYLLGWYAHAYLRFDGQAVALGATSLVAMLVAAFLGRGDLCLPEYCLVAPYGALAFLAFERFATCPITRRPVAALLADRSFGIYVIHPLFLHVIVRVVSPLSMPWGVYEALAFAVALAGSVVAVGLLRRIPGFASII